MSTEEVYKDLPEIVRQHFTESDPTAGARLYSPAIYSGKRHRSYTRPCFRGRGVYSVGRNRYVTEPELFLLRQLGLLIERRDSPSYWKTEKG